MADDEFDWQLHGQQRKAEHFLETILEEGAQEDLENLANQSSVEHELNKPKLLQEEGSDRTLPRLLYVTSDLSVLEKGAPFRKLLLSLGQRFSEVHIVLSVPVTIARRKTKRIEANVWLYTTGHIKWWKVPIRIKGLVNDELVFTDGFRPDLVVTDDPFMSGLGAYLVAEKYGRPFQLHVKEPFWTPAFMANAEHAKWKRRIANYLLKRAASVRGGTKDIAVYLKNKYKLSDVYELPRHYDIHNLVAAAQGEYEGEKLFQQFHFVILFVGRLDHKSTLFRAIDASRALLQNNSIALVVVGDGPAKKEFKERAKILGIERQVVFRPETTDLLPYLISADVMIISDTTEASDELTIKAAAAGVPLLLAKTQLRDDLFEDKINAYLCEPEDTLGFAKRLYEFLNTPSLRSQFSSAVQEVVKTRLYEDPEAFLKAYSNSMMQVFEGGEIPVDEPATEAEDAQTVQPEQMVKAEEVIPPQAK